MKTHPQLQIDFRFDEPETQGTTGQSARQTAVTAARSKKAQENRWTREAIGRSPRSHGQCLCRAEMLEFRLPQNKCLRFGRQTDLLAVWPRADCGEASGS
jgi:hypothetical protein